MAKRKEDQPEVFYVGVSQPTEMRRNVLEAMKDTILVLKTYERISQKRTAKVEKILKLKTVVGEIDLLLNAVKRRLPKTRVRAQTAEDQTPRAKTRTVPRLGEIERLEQELGSIEEKLGKL